MITIPIKHVYTLPINIAVVFLDEDGNIEDCNHDCDTESVEVSALEFDKNSGYFIDTGTEWVDECKRCGAQYNEASEEFEFC